MINSGMMQRCITGDELGAWLAKIHKAPNKNFEVNAFANIGINPMIDWTLREAVRIYDAVEASKFRGIDRYISLHHESKTGNAQWLDL